MSFNEYPTNSRRMNETGVTALWDEYVLAEGEFANASVEGFALWVLRRTDRTGYSDLLRHG